jgi:cobalt/nickel transport system ATP-binding protein
MAYSWADYVYIFAKGKIIGEGKPGKVFRNKDLLTEADLIQPWIVEIYEELIDKGVVDFDSSFPKSRQELLSLI